jgi:hypothetical protein
MGDAQLKGSEVIDGIDSLWIAMKSRRTRTVVD